MDDEKLRALMDIVKRSTCPTGCKCHALRPDDLCKARRTSLGALLECLEEHPENCSFAMAFGGGFYCNCTTRKEIACILGE